MTAMDTSNTMMKKQILEMLASVLLYSENGYQLVLDSLDLYRVSICILCILIVFLLYICLYLYLYIYSVCIVYEDIAN